jgi:hypothetical protein
MRRVILEDVVVLSRKLVAFSDAERQQLCQQQFEARHVQQKVRKRLGAVAAKRVRVPELTATSPAVASGGLTPHMLESMLSVLTALRDWKHRQAERNRSPRVRSRRLPAGDNFSSTAGVEAEEL